MAQLGQTVSMYQNLNTQNTNINEVAFSGSYTDLANTPVISAIGHSGQYTDVLNPPTRVSQFSNDSNYAVIGQKVSEFVNDSNYAVIGQKVSEFANDAQYTVNGSNVSQFANNSNYAVRGDNISEFSNNSNYAVRGENVSEFANNSNYTPTGSNVSQFANDSGYYAYGANPTFSGLTISGAGQNGSFSSANVGNSYGVLTCTQRGITCWDVSTYGNNTLRQFSCYPTLICSGDAQKPGGGSWTASSDARNKKNVVPYATGTQAILQLNPVAYQYAGVYDTGPDDGTVHVGFVAQDLQKVIPELTKPIKAHPVNHWAGKSKPEITGEEEDHIGVDPSNILYMLINAVKELTAHVAVLEARN